jgi:hypothetical protein
MKYLMRFIKMSTALMLLFTSVSAFSIGSQGQIESIDRSKAVIITINGVQYSVARNQKIKLGRKKVFSSALDVGDLVMFEFKERKGSKIPKITFMEVVLY